jgi:hypothetical protein
LSKTNASISVLLVKKVTASNSLMSDDLNLQLGEIPEVKTDFRAKHQ